MNLSEKIVDRLLNSLKDSTLEDNNPGIVDELSWYREDMVADVQEE